MYVVHEEVLRRCRVMNRGKIISGVLARDGGRGEAEEDVNL